MDIKKDGSQLRRKGSPDWFTGSVRIDPLFQAAQGSSLIRSSLILSTRKQDEVTAVVECHCTA
jgi:hypothetical protein